MIFYWDKSLVCRFVNHACVDWFNITPFDLIDKKTLEQLLGTNSFRKNKPFITEALNGNEQVFKLDITIPTGQVKNAITTFVPHNDKGVVKGFYAQIVDVSSLNSLLSTDDLSGVEVNGNFKNLLEAIAVLKANITKGFPGMAKLAKAVSLSESTLKRDFKANYGVTVFDYYRHLQMELAEKYFLEKRITKGQMAVLLNFSNPSNFSVCYQKYLAYKDNLRLITDQEKVDNEYCQTMVKQLPVAVAMFNNEMLFITASTKWIEDNKLQGISLKGKSFYEIFPGSEANLKAMFEPYLTGAKKNGIKPSFEIKTGKSKTIRGRISTWKKDNNGIGGLIVYFEDLDGQNLKV
jgi:AraC-like DNA-binding protein